jgi:hypothetical protein
MTFWEIITLFVKALLACIAVLLLFAYAVEALARLLMAWGYGG